jgi:hypothetical protein
MSDVVGMLHTTSGSRLRYKVCIDRIKSEETMFLVQVWMSDEPNVAPTLAFGAEDYFVGRSTNVEDDVGRAVLIKSYGNRSYVHIGASIKTFYAESPIVSYAYCTGPEQSVSAHARDENGHTYLFNENTIVCDIEPDADVYATFSRRRMMLPRGSTGIGLWNLEAFGIGQGRFNLIWHSNPEGAYGRLMKLGEPWVKVGGVQRKLTQSTYCQLLREFGFASGLCRMYCVELVQRHAVAN